MGCTAQPAGTTTASDPTLPAEPAVTLPPETVASPSAEDATPTEWLPYHPAATDKNCELFTAVLPIAEGAGLSEGALAQKLFEKYPGHYLDPDPRSTCRLDDFRVDRVRGDQKIAILAAQQNVDDVVRIIFSVRIAERGQRRTGSRRLGGTESVDHWGEQDRRRIRS